MKVFLYVSLLFYFQNIVYSYVLIGKLRNNILTTQLCLKKSSSSSISNSQSGQGFGRNKEASNNIESGITENNAIKDLSVTDNNIIIAEDKNLDIVNRNTSDEDKILNTKMFQKDRLRKEEALNEKIKRLKDEEDLIASDTSVGKLTLLLNLISIQILPIYICFYYHSLFLYLIYNKNMIYNNIVIY